MKEVLIVDDEAGMRTALAANFQRRGWRVRSAGGVGEALNTFRLTPSRLVITDMRMADGDGWQVMEGVRQFLPETPVILLTAYGSVPDAVQAMRGGACDYLEKPISFEELESAAERFLAEETESEPGTRGVEAIGESPSFRKVMEHARRAARSEADILIEAESGTGKELLARLIHLKRARRPGPLWP